MRKLIANTFVTLDGVMQAPGGPEEDPTGGFTHGGWSVKYWDETMVQQMTALLANPFDLLLGRRTYEIFAASWPHVQGDPIADSLNAARKHVASRSLSTLDWANSTLIRDDLAAAVAALKRDHGPEIQIHGSGNLIQSLLPRGLIDEFRLWIFPLVLGTGKRLFDSGTVPGEFRLLESTASSTGVIIATFALSGAVAHEEMQDSEVMSRFALEEPTEAEKVRRQQLADQA
jgi:dihydrofolate reductase